MIRQLGTVGFFMRYTSGATGTYRLMTVYDSYAKDNQIAQMTINFNTRSLSASSSLVSSRIYVDGINSSSVTPRGWQHVALTFSPKISIDSSKEFIVEFGSSANPHNVFIQNVYMNNNVIQNEYEAGLINSAFNGTEVGARNSVSASVRDIIFIDYPETNYSSSSRNVAYQPRFGHKKFLLDVDAVGSGGCVVYLSEQENSYVLLGDQFFVDSVKIDPGGRVLSRNNGKIISVNSNGTFSSISSSVGDIVYVLDGNRNKNKYFIKTTSSSWQQVDVVVKYKISEHQEEPIIWG